MIGVDPVPAEQEEGEEARLQEEGEDPLRRQGGAEDVANVARVNCPVGAEVELHDDAGGHPDGEVETEDADPELRHPLERLVAGAHVAPQQVDDDQRQADGQRREDVVEHDGEGELKAG